MTLKHTIAWFNPKKTILKVTIHGKMTWDDYHTLSDLVREQIATVDHTVHIITMIDTLSSPFPAGGAMPHFNQTIERQLDNYGVRVIVNAPTLLKVTIRLFQQATNRVYDLPIYFANTPFEAERIIENWEVRQAQKRFRFVAS